ncbi:MAG: hypothetical protein JWQ78_1045 [Sediminibacterium sp.]|nr:hypothetical protein [Sediminibacterium sp.]
MGSLPQRIMYERSHLFPKTYPMAKTTATPKTAKKAVPKKALVKKATPKKVSAKPVKTSGAKKPEKTISLKYADKSAGQPELVEVFEAIKKMILPYEGKSGLKLHAGTGGQLNLVSHKPVVIAGRQREELWFVSALVQKGYVGFYYMPINMNDDMRKQFSPEFMKCLKSKACFHIKNTDPVIMADIKKAIKVGYDAY